MHNHQHALLNNADSKYANAAQIASMSNWGLGKMRKKSKESEGENASRAEPNVREEDVIVVWDRLFVHGYERCCQGWAIGASFGLCSGKWTVRVSERQDSRV